MSSNKNLAICKPSSVTVWHTISGTRLSNFNKKLRSFCDFRAKITRPLAPRTSQRPIEGLDFNGMLQTLNLDFRDVQFRCCGGQRSGLTCVPKSGGRWVYRPKVGTIRKSLQGVVGFLIWGWYLCMFLCESSFKKVRMQESEKIHRSNVMGCLFRKSPNWERNIALRETWFTPEKRISKQAHQRVMDSSLTQFTYSNQLTELKYCGVVQVLSKSSFNQKTSLWNRKLKGVAP